MRERIVGLSLVASSFALAALAWYLYEAGVPGAPEFPVTDRGIVEIQASPGVKIERFEIDHTWQESAEGVVQGVTVFFDSSGASGQDPSVEIRLAGPARIVPPENEREREDVRIVETSDDQRFTYAFGQYESFDVYGTMITPAITNENARYHYAAPLVRVLEPNGDCCQQVSNEVTLYTDLTAPRPDYSSLQPDQVTLGTRTGATFFWADVNRVQPVLFSYADLIDEARGQSHIFISGVLVGLGTTAFSIGIGRTLLRSGRSAGRRQ